VVAGYEVVKATALRSDKASQRRSCHECVLLQFLCLHLLGPLPPSACKGYSAFIPLYFTGFGEDKTPLNRLITGEMEDRRSHKTVFGYCLIVALGACLFGLDQGETTGFLAMQR
jgi:hypothetical protein